MFKNIFFVGGIHGVGKSTICIPLTEELQINYLSASEVLKWNEVSNQPSDKKVEDIDLTQDLLISGLQKRIVENESYLLDGHFCLFDAKGEIARIPENTFKKMKPAYVGVVKGNPEEVSNRLKSRDGKNYDKNQLEYMQIEEIKHAKYISELLQIPYFEITTNSIEEFKILLTNFKI